MTAVVIVALVIIGLFLFAAGYVWGCVQHPDGPEKCRDKLRGAEQSAQMWRNRAVQLEDENTALKIGQAKHERAETATVVWLLEQLDEATAAAARPASLALPAGSAWTVS